MNFLIDRHDHPNRLKVLYHLIHPNRLNPLSHLLFPQRHFHYQKNIPHIIHFLHSLHHYHQHYFNYSLRLYLHSLLYRLLPRLYCLNEKNLLMSLLAIFCVDVLILTLILFPSPYFLTTDHHQKSTTRNQANTSHHYKTSNHNYNFRIQSIFMVSIAYSINK